VRASGAWTEVIPYVQGIREPLRETLARLDPPRVAINWSRDDVVADGLGHGLYRLLLDHLRDTPYGDRLVSAEHIISRLRCRKSVDEIDRIRAAIATTDEIFREVSHLARPGVTELEISRFMHEAARRRGVEPAWTPGHCPIVTTGPDSMIGHGMPNPDLSIHVGRIFHLDFGVRERGYCSDVQRCWYVPRPGELEPPAAVRSAFDAVVASIDAAAEALRPGVAGWQVDEAARQTLLDAGYPSYDHATGHHVGRAAHDGGGVLGPRWDRYGRTPEYPAEAGHVVTLELGVEGEHGYIGLEEMVLVTDRGCEFLTRRQTTLPRLGSAELPADRSAVTPDRSTGASPRHHATPSADPHPAADRRPPGAPHPSP
jgi:Xaa-Pro aminopeptidase